MVLGTWSRKDRLYGARRLQRHRQRRPGRSSCRQAIERLPEGVYSAEARASRTHRPPAFAPSPPLERHITEGSFFVGDDKTHPCRCKAARPSR